MEEAAKSNAAISLARGSFAIVIWYLMERADHRRDSLIPRCIDADASALGTLKRRAGLTKVR